MLASGFFTIITGAEVPCIKLRFAGETTQVNYGIFLLASEEDYGSIKCIFAYS